MNIKQLKRLIIDLEKHNLFIQKKTEYHYQIKDKVLLINLYINTKNNEIKVYVDKTTKAFIFNLNENIDYAECIKCIINCVNGEQNIFAPEVSKRKNGGYRKIKLRLLEQNCICKNCNTVLDKQTATIDHIIPLSRGGLNNNNNYQLLCHNCNQKKANLI